MEDASHAPGTDLMPLAGGSALPRELTVAADVALGAGARAANVALRAGATGLELVRAAGSLPGAGLARRAVWALARPLAHEGADARRRAVAEAERLVDALIPAVIARVDVGGIVRRIDVEDVVRRIDVEDVVRRIDVEALLARVDVDALIARVDVDAIAARIDVNAVVQRVDVDAVVEETELGTIVARSTSGFAAEALDAARTQTVSADTLVTRLVDRMMRRRGDAPLGPEKLVHDELDEP